jgi:hypothetical protein
MHPSVLAMAPSGIDEGKGMRVERKGMTRKEINRSPTSVQIRTTKSISQAMS